MNNLIQDKTYIPIKSFFTDNMVSFNEVRAQNEFERFFVSFSTVRMECELNIFIKEFLEDFYFPRGFKRI